MDASRNLHDIATELWAVAQGKGSIEETTEIMSDIIDKEFIKQKKYGAKVFLVHEFNMNKEIFIYSGIFSKEDDVKEFVLERKKDPGTLCNVGYEQVEMERAIELIIASRLSLTIHQIRKLIGS